MYSYRITRDFLRSLRGDFSFIGLDIDFGRRMVIIRSTIDQYGKEMFFAICDPSVNKCKLSIDNDGSYIIQTARKINKTGITTYTNKFPYQASVRNVSVDEIKI